MANKTVLAIGAHPDDVELGCFATLAKYKSKGYKIHILVMTKGEKGSKLDIRSEEAIEAAKLLGAEIKVLEFKDTGVNCDGPTIQILEKEVESIKPSVVFIHSLKERHQDHRNTALASISATRNVSEVYSFETPSSMGEFSPSLFEDITDFLEIKIKSLQMHKSQNSRGYLLADAIGGLASFRAYQNRLYGKKCEAFEIIRLSR